MNKENNITKSPINKENALELFLKCKDFTVSNEIFTLLKDKITEILITNPQPKIEDLNKYYESDLYISHTDSNKSFIDKIYQKVKIYAIDKKIKLIKKSSDNIIDKNILDIGCGTGAFLSACKKEHLNVVGVEPNKNARVLAKSKLEILTSNSNNINNDYPKVYETINALEETFDIITMWHVLEHVPNLEDYINQLKKLLKPNGVLIIAVPNYKSFDASHYKEFWAAYDVPRHLWHFSKKSISLLFKKINMEVIKTIPMKFDSYYVSLLSEKYKTGKSNILKAFFIGWLSNIKAYSTKEYSSLIYIIKNS
jgi:2-polyprenyl-3-methyl-5-hydroxy-6-metoxy-1,4-benzoquinol methylase